MRVAAGEQQELHVLRSAVAEGGASQGEPLTAVSRLPAAQCKGNHMHEWKTTVFGHILNVVQSQLLSLNVPRGFAALEANQQVGIIWWFIVN